MTLRQTHTVPVAAAKAGISQSTGYRLQADPTLPSQKKTSRGRRRPDPLADIFDSEVVPLLQSSPGIRPVAIYEEIRRQHPELGTGFRRTLERRIRAWKAEYGPEQEVIFRQTHAPGKMGLSDFTAMGKLGVTIAGDWITDCITSGLPIAGSSTPTSCWGVRAMSRWPKDCRTPSGHSAPRRTTTALTACQRRSRTWISQPRLISPIASMPCAAITA